MTGSQTAWTCFCLVDGVTRSAFKKSRKNGNGTREGNRGGTRRVSPPDTTALLVGLKPPGRNGSCLRGTTGRPSGPLQPGETRHQITTKSSFVNWKKNIYIYWRDRSTNRLFSFPKGKRCWSGMMRGKKSLWTEYNRCFCFRRRVKLFVFTKATKHNDTNVPLTVFSSRLRPKWKLSSWIRGAQSFIGAWLSGTERSHWSLRASPPPLRPVTSRAHVIPSIWSGFARRGHGVSLLQLFGFNGRYQGCLFQRVLLTRNLLK